MNDDGNRSFINLHTLEYGTVVTNLSQSVSRPSSEGRMPSDTKWPLHQGLKNLKFHLGQSGFGKSQGATVAINNASRHHTGAMRCSDLVSIWAALSTSNETLVLKNKAHWCPPLFSPCSTLGHPPALDESNGGLFLLRELAPSSVHPAPRQGHSQMSSYRVPGALAGAHPFWVGQTTINAVFHK
jgi:hypothetical protein